MKNKIAAFSGLKVIGYRTLASHYFYDGTTKDYKTDLISIELDPEMHHEGFHLDKNELKSFIRILKKNLRNAHKNDITFEENFNG